MANRNFLSQKLYQFQQYPVLLNCVFTVNNTLGAGVSGLQGMGVRSVFMNSSAPSAANPNPAAGIIQVQLQDCYNGVLGVWSQAEGPVTGADLTTLSAGVVYQITAVGTTTQTQWETRGVVVGMPAAAGVTFVCKSAGAIGGTGTAKALAAPGVDSVDLMSDNSNMQVLNSAVNGGSTLILACRNAGALAAPAAGTLIRLNMYLSNSSQVPAV